MCLSNVIVLRHKYLGTSIEKSVYISQSDIFCTLNEIIAISQHIFLSPSFSDGKLICFIFQPVKMSTFRLLHFDWKKYETKMPLKKGIYNDNYKTIFFRNLNLFYFIWFLLLLDFFCCFYFFPLTFDRSLLTER